VCNPALVRRQANLAQCRPRRSPCLCHGGAGAPPALLHAIDALRWAFLWNVEGRASGAKCLIAWEQVCRPKEEGGLGITSLSERNACLQLKLLHRLHSPAPSSWARWSWLAIDGPVGAARRPDAGPHWRGLATLMPLYRSISTMVLGDGRRTCFWLDDWLCSGALCHRRRRSSHMSASPRRRSRRCSPVGYAPPSCSASQRWPPGSSRLSRR
jgi:hypothetical protein